MLQELTAGLTLNDSTIDLPDDVPSVTVTCRQYTGPGSNTFGGYTVIAGTKYAQYLSEKTITVGGQVKTVKRNLLATLIDLKRQGKRICGYGAPGKGNTMLNYCGIGPELMPLTLP